MLKSTLFKWIIVIGSVSILGISGAAMSYSFILLPRAPVINSFALSNACSPILTFTDKSSNESGFLVSFRPQGAQNFTLIMVLPSQSGHGTTVTTPASTLQFPDGTYEIKVAAYNSYGQMSDEQTVTINTCPNSPPLPSGFLVAPLIVHVEVVNACDVRIDFVDFNEPPSITEDGLRVWRLPNGTNGTVIADLPPAGISSYADVNVGAGNYQYMVSAYTATDEAFSNYSVMVDIPFQCDNVVPTITPAVTDTPTPTLDKIIITPKKLSCEWDAAENVFLRKGPDVGLFDRLTDVQKGQKYPIIGQSEDGTFWAVEISPGVTGYITKSEKYSRTAGDCGDVPTLTDPEPPEVAPIPTKKPGDPASPTAVCSDGLDNDGDGFVDYNSDPAIGDSGCSSADDNSE